MLHALAGGVKKIPGDGIKKTWWVVLTIEDYRRLADGEANIAELLSLPEGIGDIEFDPPRSREHGTPAMFD